MTDPAPWRAVVVEHPSAGTAHGMLLDTADPPKHRYVNVERVLEPQLDAELAREIWLQICQTPKLDYTVFRELLESAGAQIVDGAKLLQHAADYHGVPLDALEEVVEDEQEIAKRSKQAAAIVGKRVSIDRDWPTIGEVISHDGTGYVEVDVEPSGPPDFNSGYTGTFSVSECKIID